MCLRISSVSPVLLLLAGCGAESPPPEGDTIACAIGEDAAFADVCTLERGAGGSEVIIHHPDGGFRRLTIDPANGAPAALDGADALVLEQGEGVWQFAIGPDRYRLPRQPGPAPTP